MLRIAPPPDFLARVVRTGDRWRALDSDGAAACLAVAGVVRRADGIVTMAPNLGWIDVPLGSRLTRALSTALPIHLLNDADAGVLGEHRRGVARGVDDVNEFLVSLEMTGAFSGLLSREEQINEDGQLVARMETTYVPPTQAGSPAGAVPTSTEGKPR